VYEHWRTRPLLHRLLHKFHWESGRAE